jgi:hypothetical protein
MKLNYKILWLDDKIDEFFIQDEYDQVLKKHLSDQGFLPEIITVSTEDAFFQVLNDSFDLIMTDYHLNDDGGSSRNGDLIVTSVREKSIFTEVLFYSARGEVKDIKKINRITFVETSKMTGYHQDNIIQEALKLIDLTIKKFHNIVVMRGLIMQETSVLDDLAFEILKDHIIGKGNSDINDHIFNSLISFHRKKHENCMKYQDKNQIEKIFKDPFLLSSNQRATAIGELLKLQGVANFMEDFKKEIIEVRNKFAHAVLEKREDGQEFFRHKSEEIIFDHRFCVEIRANINKHKRSLEALAQRMKASPPNS